MRLFFEAQEPFRQTIELGARLLDHLPLLRQLVRKLLDGLQLMSHRLFEPGDPLFCFRASCSPSVGFKVGRRMSGAAAGCQGARCDQLLAAAVVPANPVSRAESIFAGAPSSGSQERRQQVEQRHG